MPESIRSFAIHELHELSVYAHGSCVSEVLWHRFLRRHVQSMEPSRSRSASCIMSSISSSVCSSPSDFNTLRSSSAEMVPLLSWSKTWNACRSSSSTSVSLTSRLIIDRNSGPRAAEGYYHPNGGSDRSSLGNCVPEKSIVPVPSASTSLIMSRSSSSVGFCPSDRMMPPSSSAVISPATEVNILAGPRRGRTPLGHARLTITVFILRRCISRRSSNASSALDNRLTKRENTAL